MEHRSIQQNRKPRNRLTEITNMLNRFFTEVPKQFKGGRTDLTKYGTGQLDIYRHTKKENPHLILYNSKESHN